MDSFFIKVVRNDDRTDETEAVSWCAQRAAATNDRLQTEHQYKIEAFKYLVQSTIFIPNGCKIY